MADMDIRAKLTFEVEDREFDRHRRDVKRFGQDSSKEMGVLGRNVQGVGSMAKRWIGGVFVAVLLALVAALKNAVAATARFRAEMAQVATLTGKSGFVGLRDQVLDLAKRLPVALSDLTKGLYQAVSAGIEAGKAVKFLDVAARAAVGGAATVTQAVQGLTAALNGFAKKADEAESVADTLFIGVKRGVTTFGELSSQIGNVSGLANEANISLEETVAATAALTLTTNDTSRAVTQLRGIIQKLIKPTEQGQQALDRMGVSFDKNTIREKGFRQALMDVVEAAERTNVPLGQIFEDVEGLSGVLTLANAQSESFASILAEMDNKAGASQAAFLEMKDEATNIYETLKRNLNVRLIQLGEKILPTVNKALEKTLELMRSFDSPAQNLLEVLRDLPGVDERLLQQLEIQVARDRLIRQRQTALKTLQENASVRTNVRLSDQQPLGPVMTLFRRDIADLREKTAEELDHMIADYVSALTRLRSANLSEMEGIDRERMNKHITLIEDQIQKVQEVIQARTELKVINEQLGRTEVDLRRAMSPDSFDTGFDPLSIPPGTRLWPGGDDDDKPSIDPEDLAKAQEAFRKISEVQQIAARMSGEEKEALGKIFELQEQIREIEKNKKLLGQEAGEEQLEFARSRLRLAQLELAKAEELRRKVLEAAQSFNGLATRTNIFGNATFGAGSANRISDLTTGRDEQRIIILEKALRQLSKAELDDLEAIERALERAKKEGVELEKVFQAVASGIRAIARFADIFGDLSDDARRLVDGLADVLDNIGNLKDIQKQLRSQGVSLSSAAGVAAQLPSYIGLAAGIASAVAGFIGALQKDGDARLEEIRELQLHRAEQVKLRKALADSARAFKDAVARTFGGGIVGGAFSKKDLAAANDVLGQLEHLATQGTVPGIGGLQPGMIIALLQKLEDTGIPAFENLTDRFEELVAGGFSFKDALSTILFGDQGIKQVLETLVDNFGSFADTIEGLTTELEFRRDLLGESASQLLDVLIERIQSEGIDLGGELEAFLLNALQGIDLSTEEGVEQLRTMIRQLMQLFSGKGTGLSGIPNPFLGQGDLDLFANLSPEDFKDFLDLLGQLADQAASSLGGDSGEFSRGVQIARAITEIQANEMVALTEEEVYLLGQILGAVRLLVRGLSGQGFEPRPIHLPPNLAGAVNSLTTSSLPLGTREALSQGKLLHVQFGDIHVTAPREGFTEQDIREVSRQFADLLRAKVGRHGKLSF